MPNRRASLKLDDPMSGWDDPTTAEVVTLAEATMMCGVTPQAIKQAIFLGQIKARRAFTGGTWLINLASLKSHYLPKREVKDYLTCLKLS